jgi:branched-chain amino acid transport system ATP-binding protein
MLNIKELHAFYGKSHILHGVNLTVAPGEIVSLLGRNGSGRSTLAKAIVGQVESTGDLTWQHHDLKELRPFEIARLGVGYVPESREIFAALTVEQNLLLGEQSKRRISSSTPWRKEDMYRLFPRLLERQHVSAGVLSGGEQQMLTLCRTLMGNPDMIVIDEPTEGLAPKIVDLVKSYLLMLKERGLAVLLIEQKLTIALDVADRVAVMGQGRIVFEGQAQALKEQEHIRKEWLEV